MATPSSILAWRIPWTKEPGGLQSMGSQRVGHDRANKRIHTQNHRWKRKGTTDLLNHRLVIALESCAAELGGGRVWVPYSMPVALFPSHSIKVCVKQGHGMLSAGSGPWAGQHGHAVSGGRRVGHSDGSVCLPLAG